MQVLQRCLNARQFGLKMIANVSYGYTSASFSGRMPLAELADAIVAVRGGLHTLLWDVVCRCVCGAVPGVQPVASRRHRGGACAAAVNCSLACGVYGCAYMRCCACCAGWLMDDAIVMVRVG